MPTTVFRNPLRLVGIALISVLVPLSAFAQAADDILGLRLGMSEDDAIATLESLDPALNVEVFEASYNFSDGADLQSSPAFIDFVRASSPVSGEITIKFTPPPGAPRTVAITRLVYMHAPPSHAQLKAELSGKYGPPVDQLTTIGMPSMVWLLGSGSNCLGPASLPLPAIGHTSILDWLRNVAAEDNEAAAGHGAGCARLLLAQMGAVDPARSLTVMLTDLAGWAAAEIAAQDWVAQLEAEAIEAREARGAAPRL